MKRARRKSSPSLPQLLQRSPVQGGAAFSSRRDLGWSGSQFCPLLRACHQGRTVPFDLDGRRELERVELPEYTDDVWHGYLPEARPGTVYGYRVHGPYEPDAGHRFNPNKLCRPLRQAARRRSSRWGRAFRLRVGSPRRGPVLRRRDSAPLMPKCRVVDPAFAWGHERKPAHPMGTDHRLRDPRQGIHQLTQPVPPQLGAPSPGLAHLHVAEISARSASPRRSCCRSTPLSMTAIWSSKASELLGLQQYRPSSRRSRATSSRRSPNEFKEMVAAARRRHRGDPRRRLQPHRRRQRARARRCRSGHRQRRLLPACCRTSRATTSTTPAAATRFNLTHPRVLQMVMD